MNSADRTLVLHPEGALITHFAVVDYDGRRHGRFLRDSFVRSSRRPAAHIERAIMRPGVRVLLAAPHDDGDNFLGWGAFHRGENRVVYVYVKHLYRRRPGEESPFRIATSLAIAAGITHERPVLCSFWGKVPGKLLARRDPAYPLEYAPQVLS